MIAPYTRKRAPRGFLAIRAGEVSRSGQVAPARRTRSWECESCGEMVRDDVRLLSLHRRGHQTSEAPQTSDRSGSAGEPAASAHAADATASPAAPSGRLA